ncbi:MAG: TerD family protein [Thermoflexibacter sp.]|jgi:tellurium resistance protein TerZ|nr:TerD family protein [Thermoflexibacter sp.]
MSETEQIFIKQIGSLKPDKVNIGINWGAIAQKKLLGIFPRWEDVNLDICVAIFDDNKDMIDLIYPAKTHSSDKAVYHSGDDTTGDKSSKGDSDDNETISIDFDKLNQQIEQMVFFLVSANRQDFAHIPYSKVRIYSGETPKIENLFVEYNISAQKKFAGKVAMVLGKLYRTANNWEFKAIGEGLTSEKLLSTVSVIKEKFLA